MKMKKIIVTICLCLIFYLVVGSKAQAHDASVKGTVTVTVDSRSIPLPGVVVYREDSGRWKSNKGTFSVTDSSGNYSFANSGSTGSKSCGDTGDSDNKTCGIVVPGQTAGQSVCPSTHYHCGFSCNDENTPQYWLAYFPYEFDKSVLPAGVAFIEDDLKGGGSWKVGSGGKVDSISVTAGGSDWKLITSTSVEVTYKAGEWYKANTTNNSSGISNMDITWVSTASSLACSGLQASKTTSVKAGDKLTFTCSNTLQGFTFSHYEYRIHTPDNGTDSTATDYWTIPSGWDNLAGATPEYTVLKNGDYQVQCRVCVNEAINSAGDKCTSWGKAL